MPETKTCSGCNGNGVQRKNNGVKVKCPVCKGSGVMITTSPYESDIIWM